MSFYDIYSRYKDFDIDSFYNNISDKDIELILQKDILNEIDFLMLLSPKAENFLEPIALKANSLTIQHFGKTILLYTPMYLANYCTNQCLYCGFNTKNDIKRKQMSLEEVEAEAKYISSKGIKHILILTGDAKDISSVEYINSCVNILKKYFNSISIEIFPLNEDEYSKLIKSGVDSLTIYQETYNEYIYDKVHLKGPKKDYRYRLDAPERACKSYINSVNIGALLGLDYWRKEAFFTGLHANYLQNKYPHVEVSISTPRIRPHVGDFSPYHIVSDKNIVQFIVALRLFLPRCGVTISTRESENFRNNILPLGVTKMSTDSNTSVGGHTNKQNQTNQFNICDTRNVEKMMEDIKTLGYQPILKNWDII
ncbi:2-iminoacetate synthase ThiH [Gottschalkia purinilytica]|uniref:2-iminoacetate synthase ThiH n=1 Tax=Gottschalkia purinilytica TaxID=1503 RepID=A0A0L0WF39_GOTPU|nr:2-iminoacetate synthase ThiH [Gottschalkia purinilytica]KNF10041.1 2-iminoacetate synthase ThiH [Gottschalkia purinilytica]